MEMMPPEIRRPEAPRPATFVYRRSVDRTMLQFCRTREERDRLFEDLKRGTARELAQHIAAHCKWMDREPIGFGDLCLELELTIHDRGAYQNYVPEARLQGEKSGWTRAMDAAARSLPYGLVDAAGDFYE